MNAPLDPIRVFAPWSGPKDRPLRLRLHCCQTQAQARATRSKHGNAREMLWMMARMCAERVFARISADDLQETIEQMSRLWLVVNWIERTEDSDA